MPRYRHTQIGWAIVISMLLPVVVLGAVVATSRTFVPLLTLIPLLAVFLLFGWLTVEIIDGVVDVRFGIGLIRRRIPLQDIASVAPVTNPWLCGWGIRFIPGGRLYNVSGTQAVELVLRDGRRVQIGTDDPRGLLAALSGGGSAGGAGVPVTDALPAPSGYTALGLAIAVALIVIATWGMVIRSTGSIGVSRSPSDIVVKGAGYTARIPASDILSVHLDDDLPSISWRTNGFSFNDRLRGHFKLADGRAAQLFVSRSHPPFITLETRRKEPIILNFDEPERTRALYEQLAATSQ